MKVKQFIFEKVDPTQGVPTGTDLPNWNLPDLETSDPSKVSPVFDMDLDHDHDENDQPITEMNAEKEKRELIEIILTVMPDLERNYLELATIDELKQIIELAKPRLDENLRKWFNEKWVRFGPDGKIRGSCARGSESEGKPKCLPQSQAHALGKKGRASAAARKRRKDPDPERQGSAINVATKEAKLTGPYRPRQTAREKFKAGLRARGFDPDLAAERLQRLLAKQAKERTELDRRYAQLDQQDISESVEGSYSEDFYNIIEQIMSKYAGRGGSDVSNIASGIIGFAERNPQYVEGKQQEIRTIKDYLGYNILVNPKDPDSVERYRRTKEQARSPEGVKKVEGAIASILGFTKDAMVQVRSNPRNFGEIYKVWGDGNFTIAQGNPDAQPDPKQGITSTVGDVFFAHYTNLKHLRPQGIKRFDDTDNTGGTISMKQGVAEATGNAKFDAMMANIAQGVAARKNVDTIKAIPSQANPEAMLAKFGMELIAQLEKLCRARCGSDRTMQDKPDIEPKLSRLANNDDGGEKVANILIDLYKISPNDLKEFTRVFNQQGDWPWQFFATAWTQGQWNDYKRQWIDYVGSLGKGVSEGLNEMDKSAPQPGRDGKVSHSTYGSRDKKGSDYFKGKEAPGKPITKKQMEKDTLDILKKRGMAEGIENNIDSMSIEELEQFVDRILPILQELSKQKSKTARDQFNQLKKQYDAALEKIYDVDSMNESTLQEKFKSKQGVAEGRENYNGLNILLQKDDDELFVKASAGSRELGHVLFVIDGDYLIPQDLEVEERYRGQGIAQTMYDYVKSKGYKIRRSGQQTDAGAGFWAKHRPQQNVWEQGVAEGFPYDVDHMPGKTTKHTSTNCTTCHGRKSMYKLDGKLFADNKPGAVKVKCPTCKGTGDKQGVSEQQLDEKCWDTHRQVGMKKKGNRMVPNCVPKESIEEATICSECGGPSYSNPMLAEKQDACYHKVKSRYKVWPSAYASGALVQCRKKGAKNWGKKS